MADYQMVDITLLTALLSDSRDTTERLVLPDKIGTGSIQRLFKSWEAADNSCNAAKLFCNVLKENYIPF